MGEQPDETPGEIIEEVDPALDAGERPDLPPSFQAEVDAHKAKSVDELIAETNHEVQRHIPTTVKILTVGGFAVAATYVISQQLLNRRRHGKHQ